MDIKRLKLHNFWSHIDTSIDFTEDFYMILGKIEGEYKSNGSGKSSIARAICFALYGNQSEEIKKDSAIYNDAKEMFVELLFELNGEDILIKRSAKRGSSQVIKITKGVEEFKPGLTAGQEMINNILGANFDIYKNTSYFKQGDLNSFSSLTPKKAKEVVINILQLDNYNRYEQLAKDMCKKVTDAITPLETTVSYLKENIKEVEENNTCKYTRNDLIKLNEEIISLNSDKVKREELISKKSESIYNIEERLIYAGGTLRDFKNKLFNFNSKIDKLHSLSEKGSCPTCEQRIDEKTMTDVVDILEKEKIPVRQEHDKANDAYNKISKELEDVKATPISMENNDSSILEATRIVGIMETELNNFEKHNDKLKGLKDTLKEKEIELNKKYPLKDSYYKLQCAFGKKGIQAHIIDSVIPEIQTTANDILTGLETKIRLSIDSQKQLKSGNIGETLDINVLTEYGERPYSNYSGGEKTLIDFALRIALSVILTRRSDCQIQTLILDEVFGELDVENRRVISKALRFIGNKFNFKKILIISHQEELQDAFPNTINVVFDGTSSHVQKEKTNGTNKQTVEFTEG